MNIISIIPARGGSKRVPKKNIKDLAGKPLIAYSIEQSLACKDIDRTIVSTDSEEIAAISKQFGAEVILRPESISNDKATTLVVLKHLLENLKFENYLVDLVVLLQPTSPIRPNNLISKAIKTFKSSDADMLVSVCESSPSNWILSINNGFLSFMHKSNFKNIRKQDQTYDKTYLLNGSIYIYRPEDIINSDDYVWRKKIIPCIMSKEESVDIDEELDFRIAELILKLNKAK